MRVLARVSSMLVLAMSVSAAGGQDGSGGVPGPTRRPLAEPSDLLAHSPLGSCHAVDRPEADAPARLRVATWNIRAALTAPPEAIAAELAAMEADVIALQELDRHTRRSGFVDQPAALADALGFHYAFAASIKWDEGDYGLAVLSRWPLTDVRRHRLDFATATEPRIVLEATVCAGRRPLRLFDHHADGWVGSRETGFGELRGILQPFMGRGFLVMGDFNELPDADGVRGLIGTGLVDLGVDLGPRPGNRRRIDYLLADPSLARMASPARVWPTDKSDHNAMIVDLEW